MRYITFIFLLCTIVISCKSGGTDSNEASKTAVTKATVPSDLPAISQEDIITLYNNADYIDYIFFNWDFSMNQADGSAVKAAVTFISDQKVESFSTSCKPVGRIIFNSKGETLQEADLYFSKGCYFYSFVNESNRPSHRNLMTEQGQGFYQKMFAQALQPAGQ